MMKSPDHSNSAGPHFRTWLPYLLIAWCLGWMAYGFVAYPNAPIKPCGDHVFCDKRHALHSEAEYEQFRHWQVVLFMSWPFGMGGGYVIRKRSRKSAIAGGKE